MRGWELGPVGAWWLVSVYNCYLITTWGAPLLSSLTHSNCDMGMSHQWPSKAHLQQGDVAFCNVNILIIITRTGGKNHLYPPLFLIKIMSTSLIKQYCLASAFTCKYAQLTHTHMSHMSHSLCWVSISCHKISSKKLLITMGSQWT